MDFKISFEQQSSEWVVVATEGEFAGVEAARAEGLTLEAVTFSGTTLLGTIKAAWGIVLNDDVTSSRAMLKALGVGQVFKSKASTPFKPDGTVFVCVETKKVLHHASHIMVLKRGMFYGQGRINTRK